MKCPQTLEVGAYVLGALVPAERDAFEKHLGECAICRAEVSELAVLPGLLGRIDYETARTIAQEGEDSAALFPVGWAGPTAASETGPMAASETGTPESVDEGVRSNVLRPEKWAGPTVNADTDAQATDPPNGKVIPLLAAAERRRAREKRRRRFVTAGVGLVAACLALVIGLGIPRVMTDPGPAFRAMSEMVADAPITAELALEPISGGTRVIMRCEYTAEDGTRRHYKLVIVSKTGGEQEVGDWTAGYGDVFEVSAKTSVSRSDIDRVEIRSAATGRPLMTYRP